MNLKLRKSLSLHISRCACLALIWLLSLAFFTNFADASIVRFETSAGNIDVKLLDQDAPKTVENFMNYVVDGDYDNTILHRSVPGFVVQGGGFTTEFDAVERDPPVENEYKISNTRGTVAMARTNDPNSATSQWFFNISDNSSNLDNQNGGFTVFGEVIGDGMNVVDEIASLETFRFAAPFTNLPLVDYTTYPNIPDTSNLVVLKSVSVVPEPTGLGLVLLTCLTVVSMIRRRA